jgi:beta-glucosidase
MKLTKGYVWRFVLAATVFGLAVSQVRSYAQTAALSLAQIPGVSEKCAPGPGAQPWMNAGQTPACRALEVIPQMTHEEKLAFRISLPRLGLNAQAGSDGPFGLAAGGRGGAPNPRAQGTTSFPDELAVASTFNRELARRLGESIGEEFTGKGVSTILGPTVNLARTWHWGRAPESFGEDPYLMTELATPEIAAIQSQHVVVVLKHYAVYDQETDRQVLNENLSEKGLHEIYLPAFESAVKNAHVGGIFCAFASLNGGPAVCSSGDQLGLLRKWGFDGFIRPEAAPDAALAAKAGTDEIQGAALDEAIKQGRLTESDLDLIVYHHLVPMFRLGVFDAPKGTAEANVSSDAHQSTGLQIAEQGTVLLKNKGGLLPLTGVKSIAVIGDDAGPAASVQATNSFVPIGKLSVPSEAITARAGASVKVVYARGTMGVAPLPPVPESAWKDLKGTYYKALNWQGDPVGTETDPALDFNAPLLPALAPPPPPPGAADGRGRGGPRGGRGVPWSARWEGSLVPPASGMYRFTINAQGTARLWIGGKPVVEIPQQSGAVTVTGMVELKAGQPVPVKAEYTGGNAMHVGWQTPDQDLVPAAVKAAKEADVAIVFAGERAGEGYDRTGLKLPGDLDYLIDAVAAANPKTIVVLNTAGPVSMPWLDRVSGVLEAWFSGQFDGQSIAAVLFGDVNPSGRLPMTFPANDQQGPATKPDEYPGDGKNANYTEGVLVGYRWYDAKNQTPLFPFGYGLSYTDFSYGAGKVDRKANGDQTVSVKVTNSGKREGDEVVQLYVEFPAEAGEAPKQLKGFERVTLKPGESKTVTMDVSKETLMAWDEGSHDWKLYPGKYGVDVGASSRDIKYKGSFTLTK